MREQELENARAAKIKTTGGDIEADPYQAEVTGEEAVGGQTPTPGQNDVDELGVSAGIEMTDSEALPVVEKLRDRDENRWELDRDSARDRQ